MLVSHIDATRVPENRRFSTGPPSVFALQDYIEEAWDKGIRPECRIQTGGVRGTRKFIGTPEVMIP